MRKQFLFLVVLLYMANGLFASENPKDSLFISRLTKLANFGKEKLKRQMEQNAMNDRNNLHHLNNYIVDFNDFDQNLTTSSFNDLTTPLNTGGNYSGNDVLSGTHLTALNNHLVAANNAVDPDIYIAVNLRLGLVIETKDIQPAELSQIDNPEAKTNKIAKIRLQNYAELSSNHTQIKTYFNDNLAAGITGEYVLFTWGKYYAISEDAANTSQAKLKLSSSGYYSFYYDGASTTITPYYAQKITAYVERATSFKSQPRNTASQLVTKYKIVIDGLKTAMANPTDIDKLLKEEIIKKYKLVKVGHYVMDTYFGAAKGEGAIDKLTELAVYLNDIDTAAFNGYVNGVKENNNWHNYWFPIGPQNTDFNKDAIATILENFKKYYEGFKYIKKQASTGVITKAQFKEYFDDHLTYGGSAHKYFFVGILRLLTSLERVNILKAISNELDASYLPRSTMDNARDEDLVIAVLATTRDEDAELVLEGLRYSQLLFKIIDKFTFDDFDLIVTNLTRWILKTFPVKKELEKLSDPQLSERAWAEMLEEKRAVYFNDNYFGRRNDEAMDEDGNIHIMVAKWFNSSNEYELFVEPYQYVLVRFHNNFTVGENKFVKGQSYLLPGLMAYMLFIQDTRAKWGTSAKIVLDVALCAIGAGEIKAAIKAAKWGRLALATADLGIGLGDIVINTAFRNEIQEEFPEFFNAWQKISLCYGIGRLTQVGLEAAVKKAYAESFLIKNSDEFTEETRLLADDINEEIKNTDELAEFSDEMNIEITFPRGNVIVDNIRQKVQNKINHIARVEWKGNGTFSGVHSQRALDAVGAGNYQKTVTRPATEATHGVYEAHIQVRNSSGTLVTKSGRNGHSTFFPDAWDEAKIMDEVENAIKFNHGRNLAGAPNEYFGFSKDGKIKIGFYLNDNGGVNSYFPILD
jgi:hypothetical protein